MTVTSSVKCGGWPASTSAGSTCVAEWRSCADAANDSIAIRVPKAQNRLFTRASPDPYATTVVQVGAVKSGQNGLWYRGVRHLRASVVPKNVCRQQRFSIRRHLCLCPGRDLTNFPGYG